MIGLPLWGKNSLVVRAGIQILISFLVKVYFENIIASCCISVTRFS